MGKRGLALRLSLTWLRWGCVSPVSEIFTPVAESATFCVHLPPGAPLLLGRSAPGDHTWGQHSLPGRVSKTSLWAATELTSIPRSSGCFSPGCGFRSAARGTGSPLPAALPCPSPAAPQPRCSPGAAGSGGRSGSASPGWAAAPPAAAWWVWPRSAPRAAAPPAPACTGPSGCGGRSAGPASPRTLTRPPREEAEPEPRRDVPAGGWGLSPRRGVSTRGRACRAEQWLQHRPQPRPRGRGTHWKVILFSSLTSWSASTVQS